MISGTKTRKTSRNSSNIVNNSHIKRHERNTLLQTQINIRLMIVYLSRFKTLIYWWKINRKINRIDIVSLSCHGIFVLVDQIKLRSALFDFCVVFESVWDVLLDFEVVDLFWLFLVGVVRFEVIVGVVKLLNGLVVSASLVQVVWTKEYKDYKNNASHNDSHDHSDLVFLGLFRSKRLVFNVDAHWAGNYRDTQPIVLDRRWNWRRQGSVICCCRLGSNT